MTGRKIGDEDVAAFARKRDDAMTLIRGRYIKELNAGDMAAAPSAACTGGIEEPLPADLDERLKERQEADQGPAWTSCSRRPASGSASGRTSTAARTRTWPS